MDLLTPASAVLFLARLATALTGSCYYPNGTAIEGKFICDPDAEFSACCAVGDMCLTNGLCRPFTAVGNDNEYWREFCTGESTPGTQISLSYAERCSRLSS